jgi:thymidine phosphorylase
LAKLLVRIGEGAGLHTTALISDMDVPLGSAVGNAIEVREAWDVLTGKDLIGPVKRFRELCVTLTAHVLTVVGEDPETAQKRAEACLTSGTAWEKAERWLIAQGAERHLLLPIAPDIVTVNAAEAGWVADIHPVLISHLVLDLGGGRKTKSDQIDDRVGIELLASVGDQVAKGQPLLRVHAATPEAAENAATGALSAVSFSSEPVAPRAVIRSS